MTVGSDDDEPSLPILAVATGAATSFASLAIGAVTVARARTRANRNIGVLAAQTGLVLSPIFAHLVVGETKRGFAFAALPLAAEIGMGILMAFAPNVVQRGPPAQQVTFFTLLSASIFASSYGVFDAAQAPARAAERASFWRGLRVSAVIDRDVRGAVIGGAL